MQSDISLQTADCLIRKKGFGQDVIHNICTDTVSYVPRGFGDWAGGAFLALLTALLLITIGGLILSLLEG